MASSKKLLYAKRLGLVTGLFSIYAALAWGLWFQIREVIAYDLPLKTIHFEEIRPPSSLEVLDSSGDTIDYWYGTQHRLYVPLSEIDPKLVDFVILLEDAKFLAHHGFDLDEIKNSIEKNLQKGKIKRGGSTITQQLVKNLFLDKERSLTRKLFEIPWALRIEKDLSKKQILELYLNTIEWGPGIYGAEAAARHFFDRSAKQLELGQAMYLALIIPNPNRFDILAHPTMESFLLKKKDDLVRRLTDEKKIDSSLHDTYANASFELVAPDAEERNYPLSHQGSYFGNRNKKAAWLQVLEKNLKPLAKGRRLALTLVLERQRELSEIPELATSDPSAASARFLIALREGQPVAFRSLAKGRELDSTSLQTWLTAETLTIEVKKNLRDLNWISP